MTTSSPEKVAAAFNEWMRRTIEEPEKFEREFVAVVEFLQAEDNNEIPSYGTRCQAYFSKLLAEV